MKRTAVSYRELLDKCLDLEVKIEWVKKARQEALTKDDWRAVEFFDNLWHRLLNELSGLKYMLALLGTN
jgi:hypothetical protein